MKTSEVYKYTSYFGLGVFAAVTLNELANIVTIPTEYSEHQSTAFRPLEEV